MADGHFDKMTEALAKDLPSPRFRHVLGVLHTATVLAEQHHGDRDRIQTAALLHDAAKGLGRQQLLDYIQEYSLPVGPSYFDFPAILHGPIGAHMAENRFGVQDSEVLDAIWHHPTGRSAPSRTLQILMAADFTEPTRDYDGVDDIRRAVREDLVQGLILVLDRKIRHLQDSDRPVHPSAVAMLTSLQEGNC